MEFRRVLFRSPGRGGGKGGGKSAGATVKARKANSTCRVCGKRGHWSGDPECTGAMDAVLETHVADVASEVCVVSVNTLSTTAGDLGRAVVDTAAAASVAGGAWTDDYVARCKALGLGEYIKEEPVIEKFRFGDGATVAATRKITAPAVVDGPRSIR